MEELAPYRNALANEKSPYLLQHSTNPVNWQPWNDAAFEEARRCNRPIFLSIGYSTCHWCHVMAHESFENKEIAGLLNEHFVSIKVDREERPDIDALYMTAAQLMTGAGGWPLSLFLLPDGKPFYAGTYFPPEDKWGRTGFKSILETIIAVWREDPGRITRTAQELTTALQKLNATRKSGALMPSIIDRAYRETQSQFDAQNGGFGAEPKFPTPMGLLFLLNYHHQTGEKPALTMVEQTLAAMARGGIYDQLGGGFHRYSTDGQWFLPHFEKMLYDQALLVTTYLAAYQVTAQSLYADVIRQTLNYVLRDLTSAEGAFFCAEDADSLPAAGTGAKREGAFYVWSYAEMKAVLGPRVEPFAFAYGVKVEGNVARDPMNEFTELNILSRVHDEAACVARFGDGWSEPQLAKDRAVLLQVRSTRPRPHRDEKVLTDWNSLMISALANAAMVLGDRRYKTAAVRAARFLNARLRTPGGELLHRFCDGQADIPGFLHDYACYAMALMDLHELTGEDLYRRQSIETLQAMRTRFEDVEHGGFFMTAGDQEAVLSSRIKEQHDGAIPSGNALAAAALLRQGRLENDEALELAAMRCVNAFAGFIENMPTDLLHMLSVWTLARGPRHDIVLVGKKNRVDAMLDILHRHFLPGRTLRVQNSTRIKGRGEGAYPAIGAGATAYICTDKTCQAPITTVADFRKRLAAISADR